MECSYKQKKVYKMQRTVMKHVRKEMKNYKTVPALSNTIILIFKLKTKFIYNRNKFKKI